MSFPCGVLYKEGVHSIPALLQTHTAI